MSAPGEEQGVRIATGPAARLDVWLTDPNAGPSRAAWQRLIREGRVTVNGAPCKRNQRIAPGDRVEWTIPAPVPAAPQPEAIALQILYEDADLIVIDKPPGLVVHPAAGNERGTLVNALLHHCDDLAGIGGELRPGIVHRLDKETSGVLVVAKNEEAMRNLARQFKARETRKEYQALVSGVPQPAAGTVDAPIGRHPVQRKKMAVREAGGREAVSHYQTEACFGDAALLRVRIETGRTHQIRVHMAHLRHPILGDRVYGKPFRMAVPRQMLHAARLELTHPAEGRPVSFEAPLPGDMTALIEQLNSGFSRNPG